MVTTVLVDVGNTRIKWRADDSGMHYADNVEDCFQTWSRFEVGMVAIAATGKQDVVQTIATHIRHSFPRAACRVIDTEKQFRSLVNSYADPATMGVDRWLALIAANESFRGNSLIIDAGSALTVDCLKNDGHHLGGWIIPGVSMMRNALLTRTARVRDMSMDRVGPFGASTGTGVTMGVRNALVAACERALRLANEVVTVDHVLLAGGDCQVVYEAFETSSFPPVFVRPELVLDGLALRLEAP